jgi:group I intron endonuclease
MNSGIYQITHKATGQIYIGQSCDLKKRKNNHKNGQSSSSVSIIGNAIKKYGWDAFDFKVLVYAEGKDYLNSLEEKIILTFNSIKPNGFNIRFGGNSSNLSESTKLALSKARIEGIKSGKIIHPRGMAGKKASEETKQKMAAAHLGKNRGEEFKLKMKEVAKKRWQNPEYRAKVLAAKGVIS